MVELSLHCSLKTPSTDPFSFTGLEPSSILQEPPGPGGEVPGSILRLPKVKI